MRCIFPSTRCLKALTWLIAIVPLSIIIFQHALPVFQTVLKKTKYDTAVAHEINEVKAVISEVIGESDDPCTLHVDTDTVHVIIMADKGSFIGMLTLANSIVQNTKSDVMFHFVTFPSDADVLRRWINGSTLRSVFHEIIQLPRQRLQGKFRVRSPRSDLATPMNFARLLLPDLLPCVGRVIYIDADCLVLGDIRELYDFKIVDGHMVAGVNMCNFNVPPKWPTVELMFNYSHSQILSLNIPRDTCIMNNGLFLADLLLWQKHNISQELQFWMELNTREPVFKYGDHGAGTQAVMNAVLHNKYTSLPKEWNTVSGAHKKVPSPKLIHWNGLAKPWLYPTVPFFKEWIKYYVPDPDGQFKPSNLRKEKKGS